MRREFDKALKEAEQSRAQATLRQGSAYRIEKAILEGKATRRSPVGGRVLALASLAAVVVLVAVVALQFTGEDAPREVIAEGPAPAPAQTPAPAPVAPPAPDAVPQRALASGETWRTPERVTVSTQSQAIVARAPEGLRILEGTARFDVDPRAPGEADVVVQVSHGRIQVLGTEFTVVQRDNGGEVTLHEGRIQFTHDDGTVTVMEPGQTLIWPRPPEAPQPQMAEVAPQAPTPERKQPKVQAAPPVDVPALIAQVEKLRQQGRYEEAVGRLQGTLSRPLPDETHERLSYELGEILTFQLKDAKRGCEVWAAHQAKFGRTGSYAGAIRSAQRTLGCP